MQNLMMSLSPTHQYTYPTSNAATQNSGQPLEQLKLVDLAAPIALCRISCRWSVQVTNMCARRMPDGYSMPAPDWHMEYYFLLCKSFHPCPRCHVLLHAVHVLVVLAVLVAVAFVFTFPRRVPGCSSTLVERNQQMGTRIAEGRIDVLRHHLLLRHLHRLPRFP